MALAVSLTSESNPAPATLTKCRLPPSVVTRMASIRTVFGAASRRTAASKLPAPIVLAKSSPVPAGRTARAASVPIRPLAAQETVPSPPITATIPAPSPATRRHVASMSAGDSVTRT